MGKAKRLSFILPLVAAVALLSLVLIENAFGQFFNLPPQPPPHEYGTIVMDRTSRAAGEKPVVFSHWTHRLKYTCRVCHFELEFEFKAGATPITEEDNRNGLYCGKCHNGYTAFGHTVNNCKKCHGKGGKEIKKKFNNVWKRLPHSEYGNRIDWVRAYKVTRPKYSIFLYEKPIRFKNILRLEAELTIIPPAVFPHWEHVQQLDCSNCHPWIFNLKKKTTKHFSMDYILKGKFCGVCHTGVAFPIDNCKGCHPGIGKH
ncbi:MAG TPA: hypothetical protein ENI12_05685 [Nitrospirae bacterium]|nr:hypothetical protein [Nitrospirota bacterium]